MDPGAMWPRGRGRLSWMSRVGVAGPAPCVSQGVTQGLEKLPLAPGLLLATLSNAFRCYICIVSKVNSPLFMP